jgi:hypothetical protein
MIARTSTHRPTRTTTFPAGQASTRHGVRRRRAGPTRAGTPVLRAHPCRQAAAVEGAHTGYPTSHLLPAPTATARRGAQASSAAAGRPRPTSYPTSQPGRVGRTHHHSYLHHLTLPASCSCLSLHLRYFAGRAMIGVWRRSCRSQKTPGVRDRAKSTKSIAAASPSALLPSSSHACVARKWGSVDEWHA